VAHEWDATHTRREEEIHQSQDELCAEGEAFSLEGIKNERFWSAESSVVNKEEWLW
jgi:hypothetical protein